MVSRVAGEVSTQIEGTGAQFNASILRYRILDPPTCCCCLQEILQFHM